MNHLIVMPTLRCNALCDYCYVPRKSYDMRHEDLSLLLTQIINHMEKVGQKDIHLYWQGGEVMCMEPSWYMETLSIMNRITKRRKQNIFNHAQSNFMGYEERWNPVISQLFFNEIGSSLDFPNTHRKTRELDGALYNEIWLQKVRQAWDVGIRVGVISVPNSETLKLGAESFYSYYVYEAGITNFQISLPFSVKRSGGDAPLFPLDNGGLARFFIDLFNMWLESGYTQGVSIHYFEELIDYFVAGDTRNFPCEWLPHCSKEVFALDPLGNVMQCDCWTNFPAFWFGNVMHGCGFEEVMRSASRLELLQRPIRLLEKGYCMSCNYLAICHGGCPVRALSAEGTIVAVDPYCDCMRKVFSYIEKAVQHISPADYEQHKRCIGQEAR